MLAGFDAHCSLNGLCNHLLDFTMDLLVKTSLSAELQVNLKIQWISSHTVTIVVQSGVSNGLFVDTLSSTITQATNFKIQAPRLRYSSSCRFSQKVTSELFVKRDSLEASVIVSQD